MKNSGWSESRMPRIFTAYGRLPAATVRRRCFPAKSRGPHPHQGGGGIISLIPSGTCLRCRRRREIRSHTSRLARNIRFNQTISIHNNGSTRSPSLSRKGTLSGGRGTQSVWESRRLRRLRWIPRWVVTPFQQQIHQEDH